ncbi:GP46-like surface antigen, putative [Bodo saltans]|uniref:GP46-like surface antigen, putative n=1 Tax=Bodo saltans TaxID=75058 RepID=A0A0S4JAQ3_BODSA|nr:GP46-like surface antigen, putative [Bodo saltans]|eukprot:CUG87314.1 GP46-like surface antigen, putative [Bodo saltans]
MPDARVFFLFLFLLCEAEEPRMTFQYVTTVLVILLHFVCGNNNRSSDTINPTAERAALVLFYTATDGATWSLNDSASSNGLTGLGGQPWDVTNSSSNYCYWFGIQCGYYVIATNEPAYGVQAIQLPSCGLTGSLPSSDTWCSSLPILSILNLPNNKLQGTIPESLGQCTGMINFVLYSNRLQGTIPSSLSQFTEMINFNLRGNQLVGSLPSSLSTFTDIEFFDVSANRLSGTLPPQYASWSVLWKFDVAENALSGTLPAAYSSWGGSVAYFYVSNNSISGTLPSAYSAWTNFSVFGVDDNQFTGSFPPEYSSWGSSLIEFSPRNNQLSGSLPPEYSAWVGMTTFQVDNNPLTGTLPASYGAWKRVVYILICNTNITGPIPSSWGSMSRLYSLQLYINSLTGTLPPSLGNLTSLSSINLSMNNISGTVPVEAWSKLRVQSIMFQDNPHLSGNITASWNNIFATSAAGLPAIMSVCRTNICASKLSTLMWGYGCLPTAAIPMLLSVTLENMFSLFSIAVWTTSVECSTLAPSVAPTAQPTRTRTFHWEPTPPMNTTEMPPLERAVSDVSAVVSTAAIAAGVTGAASGGDLQMLSSVLGSTCMCGTVAATSKTMAYTTSPFANLGFAAVVVGNAGLAIAVALVFRVLLSVLVRRRLRKKPQAHAADERNEVAAMLRFPSFNIRLALFLNAGIFKAAIALITTIDDRSTAEIAAAFVGFAYVLCLGAYLETVIYRGRVLKIPLLYEAYTLQVDYHPVPQKVSRVVLPVGFWGPKLFRRQFGAITNGLRGDCTRLWCVLPLTNLATQLLFVLPVETSGGCDAVQIIGALVLIATSAFWCASHPTRALTSTLFSCASLLMVALVNITGALCRHNISSSDTVLKLALVGSNYRNHRNCEFAVDVLW